MPIGKEEDGQITVSVKGFWGWTVIVLLLLGVWKVVELVTWLF